MTTITAQISNKMRKKWMKKKGMDQYQSYKKDELKRNVFEKSKTLERRGTGCLKLRK